MSIDDFLTNQIILHCPGDNEIYAAYENLPNAGKVELTCSYINLASNIQTLETVGFLGIFIIPKQDFTRGVKIVAFKGKENPCYDTGKTANYRGSALAVLDDDHHLLFGEMPVCEKTAIIYSLPVYKKFVKMTKGNPEFIARLKTNPASFDCDTFESDVSRLAQSLPRSRSSEDATTIILYPGPFKILIMDDGTMIRRGQPVKTAKSTAHRLCKSDACTLLSEEWAAQARSPLNFKAAYEKKGSLCLIEEMQVSVRGDSLDAANLNALDDTPAEMKARLRKLIESNSEYFVMTGSDARDLNGCCPSDGVTAANQLVEAGVLQVARTNSSLDTCPVNIYAFTSEIKEAATRPEFAVNQAFRQKVKSYIERSDKSPQRFWLPILRWSLLLFVGLSLVVFALNIAQINDRTSAFSNTDLVRELDLPFQNGVLVLQFHRTQRCKFCNDMEKHTRAALNTYFADDLRNKTIAFRQLNMEQPRYEYLRKKYDLFTSTLVLIQLDAGKESRWKIITEAWYLTDKKAQFMEMFQSELNAFRTGSK